MALHRRRIGPIFASFFVAMWQMFEQDFKVEFTRDP